MGPVEMLRHKDSKVPKSGTSILQALCKISPDCEIVAAGLSLLLLRRCSASLLKSVHFCQANVETL